MRIVLLGAPGAGKGTQGTALAEQFGVPHVSSGELLRAEMAADSDVGRQVRESVARGELVPDDLVLSVVGRAVNDAMQTGGYILDGFPRTLEQAKRAFEMAEQAGIDADYVIYLAVPDDVVRERLARRAEGRVDDGNPRWCNVASTSSTPRPSRSSRSTETARSSARSTPESADARRVRTCSTRCAASSPASNHDPRPYTAVERRIGVSKLVHGDCAGMVERDTDRERGGAGVGGRQPPRRRSPRTLPQHRVSGHDGLLASVARDCIRAECWSSGTSRARRAIVAAPCDRASLVDALKWSKIKHQQRTVTSRAARCREAIHVSRGCPARRVIGDRRDGVAAQSPRPPSAL